MTQKLHITVNNDYMEVEVDISLRLVDFLRDKLFLTGTKIGCGKGECGACTVIMNGQAINSCLVPIMKADNACVETIEGVMKGDDLHPLQEEFINRGAVQCGFCTPGMIMSAKALIDSGDDVTSGRVKEAVGGNICRCTGYKKIEEAILAANDRIKVEGE